MSTLITLLAGYMTSGTWWIFPMKEEIYPCKACRMADVALVLMGHQPGTSCADCQRVMVPATLQAFRATCLTTGRFRCARGSSPSFDPATALYATNDMVSNLAAVNAITIHGDVASARRLLKSEHNWKTFLTLDQALAHPHLGKTMPKKAIILAAYADDEDISA